MNVNRVLVAFIEGAIINQYIRKLGEAARFALDDHSIEALEIHGAQLKGCRLKTLEELNEWLSEVPAINWRKVLLSGNGQVSDLAGGDEVGKVGWGQNKLILLLFRQGQRGGGE